MKIFHASLTREFAGSEMYCASLARAQAERGDEVRVVVRETPFVNRWRDEAGRAEVVVIPGWVPGFLERWVVGRMLKGFRPDVVHTHLGRADRVAGPAAKARKLPWVSTVHIGWKHDIMRRADAAICIAEWQKREIREAGYRGILRAVWNWLPPQPEVGEEVIAQVRQRWNAGPQTVVFGSVGRLHSMKGMDVLIRAFQAAYPDPETDVRLVIVGEGADRVRLETIRGPERRVFFEGYAHETAPLYAALDVYVSASLREAFGLTILEAMAHGCQIVSTRTEGPSEFLQEASGKGLVIWAERGHVESLAAALNMAKVQGRGYVTYDMAPFTVERAVREIGEVYEEVI